MDVDSTTEKQRRGQLAEAVPYLENGRYSYTKDQRILYRSDLAAEPLLEVTGKRKDKSLVISIEGLRPKVFKGQAVWFGSSGDLKIFSAEAVLTKFAQPLNLTKKLQRQRYFQDYFTVPALTVVDQQQGIIIEERVPSISSPHLTKRQLLEQVMADYLAYFQQVAADHLVWQDWPTLLANSPHQIYRSQWQQLLAPLSPAASQLSLPRLPLHGDLWSENLLVTETGLVYIDFDESHENWFFYDFFKFLWNETDVHGEQSLIQDYLAGVFDAGLSQWFHVFGLTFEPERRMDYFLLFFLDFLATVSTSYPYTGKQGELQEFQAKVLPMLLAKEN